MDMVTLHDLLRRHACSPADPLIQKLVGQYYLGLLTTNDFYDQIEFYNLERGE